MTQHQIPGDRLRSLSQQLVAVLTERIRSGQLKLGDKLSTEAELMAEHGVSRTVVREAVSQLQATGLVQTRHGIGSFVQGPALNIFKIDVSAISSIRDVLHVLELRIALEVESAGLAAQRRSDEQLADLRAALDELNDKSNHANGAVLEDFRFHLCIAQACGNQYFADVTRHLEGSVIPRSRINSLRLAQRDQASYMQRLQYEHETIFAAIARRDPEGARMAMRMHLTRSKELFDQALLRHPATSLSDERVLNRTI
ncbi:FadR/GntR family transcriptional regulator [Pseudomonas kermanshahensis]|uniref:FadR/GntR family transcriptional regulator n=1 Tax=Pseudomonas kermanshahensis TaxID=2745482 RepID=A0ABU8R467_9PSED